MDSKKDYGIIFRALGDTHRLHILSMLAEQEMNAGEIFAGENIVQSTLSHHMKILQKAGLVTARKAGRWTYYSLNRELFKEMEEFLHDMAEGGEVQTGAALKDGTVKAAGARKDTKTTGVTGTSKSTKTPNVTETSEVPEKPEMPAGTEAAEQEGIKSSANVPQEKEKSASRTASGEKKSEKPEKNKNKDKSRDRKKDKKKKHGKK